MQPKRPWRPSRTVRWARTSAPTATCQTTTTTLSLLENKKKRSKNTSKEVRPSFFLFFWKKERKQESCFGFVVAAAAASCWVGLFKLPAPAFCGKVEPTHKFAASNRYKSLFLIFGWKIRSDNSKIRSNWHVHDLIIECPISLFVQLIGYNFSIYHPIGLSVWKTGNRLLNNSTTKGWGEESISLSVCGPLHHHQHHDRLRWRSSTSLTPP